MVKKEVVGSLQSSSFDHNKALHNFIETALSNNNDKNRIKDIAIRAGWKEADVLTALGMHKTAPLSNLQTNPKQGNLKNLSVVNNTKKQ